MRAEGRRRDGSRGRMIPGANHDMPRPMIDEAMTDRIIRVVFRDKLVLDTPVIEITGFLRTGLACHHACRMMAEASYF